MLTKLFKCILLLVFVLSILYNAFYITVPILIILTWWMILTKRNDSTAERNNPYYHWNFEEKGKSPCIREAPSLVDEDMEF